MSNFIYASMPLGENNVEEYLAGKEEDKNFVEFLVPILSRYIPGAV